MVISNFEITTKKKDSEDPSVFFGCLHDFHPLWLPASARASPSFDGFTMGLQAVKCWWIASTATSTRQPLLGAWWAVVIFSLIDQFCWDVVETSRSVHWGWLNVRNIRWPSDLVLFRFQSHFGIFIYDWGTWQLWSALVTSTWKLVSWCRTTSPNSLGRLSKTAPKHIVLNYFNCELQVILDLFTTNQPHLMPHNRLRNPADLRSDNSSWGRMRSWSPGRKPHVGDVIRETSWARVEALIMTSIEKAALMPQT